MRPAVWSLAFCIPGCVSCSVMSDSLQLHGLQPTRFLCSWNSSGRNTGVGGCSLLQGLFPIQESNLGLLHCKQVLYWLSYEKKERKWSRSVVSDSATPWTVACTRILHPWDFLGKSTGVGCHFLLQGIFPTQGSNPGLPHCRQTLYHLSHKG